jgi:flagellar basal-body rod modification protein FlgD
MQITNDATQSAAAAVATPSTTTTPASTNPVSDMANEQTFLKLLVAQIQNQDPMSPSDSMQFVTQLAQFSSLEQLMGINQGIASLNANVTSATTPPAAGSTGTP